MPYARLLPIAMASVLAWFAYLGTSDLPMAAAQSGSGTIVQVTVRDGSTVLYQGSVTLPDGNVSIVDSDGTPRQIAGRSALSALSTVDSLSSSIRVSRLVYYASFGSFYLDCLQTPQERCGQWQYAINGNAPMVGIDQVLLSQGDEAYFYYGPTSRLSVATPVVEAGKAFSVVAQSYDYRTDTFVARTGISIGVTQPDPSNPYSPKVVSTTPVGASGKADLVINATGSYDLGITEDFYYPTTPVKVVAAGSGAGAASSSVVPTGTTPTASPSPSPKPIGGLPDEGLEKTDPFAAFLLSGQGGDGMIENPLVSDWAAVALSTQTGLEDAKGRLRAFFRANPDPGTFTTDLERRAMALMALGMNPFNGAGRNYIVSIVRSFSEGQFGNAELLNDDIFALFPVIRSGIVKTSYRLRESVRHILARQRADGAWENPDLTAAAIQALLLADNDPRITDAVARARSYLRSVQTPDGRIGMNAFSTAWASQALTGTGSTLQDRNASDRARSYVDSKQAPDGGLRDGEDSMFNRLWGTSYALTARSGKHWGQLLQPFSPSRRP